MEFRSSFPKLLGSTGLKLLASNSLWVVSGSVLLRLGPLLAAIVVGRLLGNSALGGASLVLSTGGVAATLFGSGIGSAATRFVAEHRVENPAAAENILGSLLTIAVGLALGMAILGFALADVVAERMFASPDLANAIRMAMPFMAFTLVSTVTGAALAGLNDFRRTAVANAAGCLMLLLAIVPATRVAGVMGAIGALSLQSGVTLAFALLGLARTCQERGLHPRVVWDTPELRQALGFAAPAVLSVAMYTPATWYGSVVLARSAHGLRELGLFGAAQQWFAVIAFIPTALSPLILSSLAESNGSRTIHRRNLLWLSLSVNSAIAGVIGLLAVSFSNPILSLYGSGFTAAVPTLRLLALSAFLGSVLVAVGQFIAARASMWWGFGLNALWAATFLALALHLAPKHGAKGLAGAYLASYAVHLLSCSAYLLTRHCGRTPAAAEMVLAGNSIERRR